MSDILTLVVLLGIYYVMIRWVFPGLGIST